MLVLSFLLWSASVLTIGVFDLVAADPIFKIHFNNQIVKEFNTAAVLYNRIFEGKGKAISNRGLEIPIHVGPNASFRWFADGGSLPASGSQRLTRSTVGFQSFALDVTMTGAAIDAGSNDAVSYARTLTFNIRNATIDAIKYLNIYSFLNGDAFLTDVNAAATLSTTGNTTVTVVNSRYLRVNMRVDFHNAHTSTVKASATIVAISSRPGQSGTTITVGPATAAAALVAGDGIANTESFSRVIQGLDGIIDDANVTFQGVDRSLFPEFKGNVLDAGSTALSREHLRRAVALIQIAQGSVNMGDLEIWSHPAQVQAYAEMGWALKRFQDGGARKLDLGYTSYEWEGIPWVVDTDAPLDKLYVLERSSLLKASARALSFDERTGGLLRQVPSSGGGGYDDKFVAYLVARFNLGAYRPYANTKIKNLVVPVGY